MRKILFLLVLMISISEISFSQNTISDEYYNDSTATSTFGLPYVSTSIDELTNTLVVTQLSSTGQENRFLCFRTTCSRDDFKVMLGSNNLNFIEYFSGVYCVNTRSELNCDACSTIKAICVDDILQEMIYKINPNNAYDIYLESNKIVKSYIDPQQQYGNVIYYTNISPGETMNFKLYIKDIKTQEPFPLRDSPYVESIFVKDSYSLTYLRTITSYGKCPDNRCLLYTLTFPTSDVPEKSLYLIPKIILNSISEGTTETSFCYDDTTKNSCISKVFILHPVPYEGDLIIEGSRDNEGRYYYGQTIKIYLQNYEEFILGDGGSLQNTYLVIENKDGIIDIIEYDPSTMPYAEFSITDQLKNTEINITFVGEYLNGFGDKIEYNKTLSIEVNDLFTYSLLSDVKYIDLYSNITQSQNTYSYLIPGSKIRFSISPYLEDRQGNRLNDVSYNIEIIGIKTNNGTLPLKDISLIYDSDVKVYEAYIPNNISSYIASPSLVVKISTTIHNKHLEIEKEINLPTILNVEILVPEKEFFEEDYFNMLLKFSEATISKIKEITLFSPHGNESIEIKTFSSRETPYNNTLSFIIPPLTMRNIKEAELYLFIETEINNKKAIYQDKIKITTQQEGYALNIYIEKNKMKKRIEKEVTITFEHAYDITKQRFYIKNIGTKNINLNELTIRLNKNKLFEEFKIVKDKDDNKEIFSPKEEIYFEIALDPLTTLTEEENILDIWHKEEKIKEIIIRKHIENINDTIKVVLLTPTIVYDRNNKKALIKLEVDSNVEGLGAAGFEIRIQSSKCAQKILYENYDDVVLKEPGSVIVDVVIEDSPEVDLEKIFTKCDVNTTMTVLLKRKEHNKTITIKAKQFDVDLTTLEKSDIGKALKEVEDALEEVEKLCKEEFIDKCNFDKEKYCTEFVDKSKDKISNLDFTKDENVEELNNIYSQAISIKTQIQRCKKELQKLENFTQAYEDFKELYEKLCIDPVNREKIEKNVIYSEKIKFENACNVYEKYYVDKTGDIKIYEKALNTLKPFEEYIYQEPEKSPYGKIFALFVILLLIVVIIGYIVVKYLPSKENIEVSKEDIYEI